MPQVLAQLPDLGLVPWLLVCAGALVVGLSKTALPGGGTIAVGLFALALPAKESTAALLLLLMVGDATALWVYRREPDVRTLVRLIPSVLVGVVLGTIFFATAGGDAVRGTIGVILLALVGVTVWRRRAARSGAARSAGADGDLDGPPSGVGAQLGRTGYGLLGGFTTMVANAGGPVMSMYFYAMRMPVLTFLGTSAWFFAVVNVLKLPFSAGLGLITRDTLVMDAVLVPLVLIGAALGARVARRLPQGVFENAVLVLTVVSALALLVL
ncbi:sulfite exporter TauE/SafE family protein [Brachybacterium sp. YJGR34]|uniref:sulfite exporter TauE/SafE family protein n=1 Tax=Brachybacterium sp. YJGR34 TaxID=2059911 RepID=UPI000E0AAEFA|nr:sulfite exporter TauE/SafE family protein [Brachybacterium sp. YJGR34]